MSWAQRAGPSKWETRREFWTREEAKEYIASREDDDYGLEWRIYKSGRMYQAQNRMRPQYGRYQR